MFNPARKDIEYLFNLTPSTVRCSSIEWTSSHPEERVGYFWLAGIEDVNLLNRMLELVRDCYCEGVSEDEEPTPPPDADRWMLLTDRDAFLSRNYESELAPQPKRRLT